MLTKSELGLGKTLGLGNIKDLGKTKIFFSINNFELKKCYTLCFLCTTYNRKDASHLVSTVGGAFNLTVST